ncbi:MAG TPA: metal-dependent hydrolase [Polyangiaceae bacterium]|nr:metal-dependent hydrolase [Polyangiaceae bacterium]
MDNVTHALAGMLVAEAVCVARGETRAELRAAAYLVSALANNLPDIDIVYTWISGPKPLGSLLHHRGHTHTLLLALPGAWLLGVAVWRRFSRQNPAAKPRDRQLLLGLSLAGVVLHLSMDYGNNYGVHPFWPLSSRWFYGDSIFIVEPLWWAILMPLLITTVRKRWLQVLLTVLLAAVLLACWFVPFVSSVTATLLLALAFASLLVARRFSERARVLAAVAASLTVPLVFGLAARSAKAELRAATQAAFPALEVLDMATTPLPANPRCWEGLVAGEQGGIYRVLRATVALGGLAPNACKAGMDVQPTAPVSLITRSNHGGVRWLTAYSADVSQLSRLRREDCRFRAMLQFARLPYAAPARQMAGDLRYDRQPDADFSDVPLPADPASGACPRLLPGWTEPRAELFKP